MMNDGLPEFVEAPEGPSPEDMPRWTCADCLQTLPITDFQHTKDGRPIRNCKKCHVARSQLAKKEKPKEPTSKEWVIAEARKLYENASKNTDKIRLLDTISKNLNGDGKGATDDVKLVRDMIAARKKSKELKRAKTNE